MKDSIIPQDRPTAVLHAILDDKRLMGDLLLDRPQSGRYVRTVEKTVNPFMVLLGIVLAVVSLFVSLLILGRIKDDDNTKS